MTKFYQSKTIRTAGIAFIAAIIAHFYGTDGAQQFEKAIALALPLVMIMLRTVTKTPLG